MGEKLRKLETFFLPIPFISSSLPKVSHSITLSRLLLEKLFLISFTLLTRWKLSYFIFISNFFFYSPFFDPIYLEIKFYWILSFSYLGKRPSAGVKCLIVTKINDPPAMQHYAIAKKKRLANFKLFLIWPFPESSINITYWWRFAWHR